MHSKSSNAQSLARFQRHRFVTKFVTYEIPDEMRSKNGPVEMCTVQAEVRCASARQEAEVLLSGVPAAGLLAPQDGPEQGGTDTDPERPDGDIKSRGEDKGGDKGAGGRRVYQAETALVETAIAARVVEAGDVMRPRFVVVASSRSRKAERPPQRLVLSKSPRRGRKSSSSLRRRARAIASLRRRTACLMSSGPQAAKV